MEQILRHPLFLFLALFILMSFSALASILLRRRKKQLEGAALDDFNIVQGATLTLLALLIGFSFSMAISRYDQRKNYEEEEANAIGTEFLRADLVSSAAGDNIRSLLKDYVQARIDFYQLRDAKALAEAAQNTARLQAQLWTAVAQASKDSATPIVALAVAGMNDVINSQGYTQAAWLNRIPVSAWFLLILIALICCILVGYSARSQVGKSVFPLVLPAMVALSMAMIADIDSPRGGLIKVVPQNLLSLQQSLP